MLIRPVQLCVPMSVCLRLSRAVWDKTKQGSAWPPVKSHHRSKTAGPAGRADAGAPPAEPPAAQCFPSICGRQGVCSEDYASTWLSALQKSRF